MDSQLSLLILSSCLGRESGISPRMLFHPKIDFQPSILLLLFCAPTAFGQAAAVANAAHEPAPYVRLSSDSLEQIVTTGLAVGANYSPALKGVKVAYDVYDVVFKASTDAVEHRTRLKENELLVISADAKRLTELAHEGRLDGDEAAEIKARLTARMRETNDSFVRDAFEDPYALYALGKYAGAKYLGDKLGDEFEKSTQSTRFAFLGESRIRKHLTRTQWKKLKGLEELAERFSRDLMKEILTKIAEKMTLEQLGKEMDSEVDRFLASLQSRRSPGSGGVGLDALDFRYQVFSNPDLYEPLLIPVLTDDHLRVASDLAIPEGAPLAQHLVMRPPELAVHPMLQVYRDAIVNTAVVQSQVLSHYNVEVSQPTTTRSYTSGYRMGGLDLHVDLSGYSNPNWDGRF